MNKTAGHVMGVMGLMDDDAKMLCKVLEISAAQALSLKKKIKMGHKLPSWAEYKIYKAGDSLKSAMASTHSMRDHMPKISISIKSGPSLGMPLSGNTEKHKTANPSNADGLSYLNAKTAPLKTPQGKRLYRAGNVIDRNYKLRARERLVTPGGTKSIKRAIRSADPYVKTSSAWAKIAAAVTGDGKPALVPIPKRPSLIPIPKRPPLVPIKSQVKSKKRPDLVPLPTERKALGNS